MSVNAIPCLVFDILPDMRECIPMIHSNRHDELEKISIQSTCQKIDYQPEIIPEYSEAVLRFYCSFTANNLIAINPIYLFLSSFVEHTFPSICFQFT